METGALEDIDGIMTFEQYLVVPVGITVAVVRSRVTAVLAAEIVTMVQVVLDDVVMVGHSLLGTGHGLTQVVVLDLIVLGHGGHIYVGVAEWTLSTGTQPYLTRRIGLPTLSAVERVGSGAGWLAAAAWASPSAKPVAGSHSTASLATVPPPRLLRTSVVACHRLLPLKPSKTTAVGAHLSSPVRRRRCVAAVEAIASHRLLVEVVAAVLYL
ncbi:hypothetical protein PIB30_101602 [Stylosanthes scabra]|uniref:Uncharacterized protein n=1 Tax=Stylosanthes scabra TaxID=79078 RepID=A0ABU6QXT2_9FABA|nr:hypothetical protein [Stylosanthes scabra]